jgi:drug/metabolite transporter (DMT)-like permease
MTDAPPAEADAATRRRAYFALALMVVIWGVNFSVSKVAMRTLTPLALNALRYPFAALVVYIALRRGGRLPVPARGDVARIVALGVLGNVIYQLFFIFGLANTHAGTASVLLAGTPIVTATLSHVFGQEQVSARTWLGVLTTFAGILLVVGGGLSAAGSTTLGNVLMVGASVSWAAYTVGSRPLIARYGSVAMTAWTLWVGTIGIVAIGLPDIVRTDFATVSPSIWLAVLYAGALSVGVAYLIWYNAIRHIGTTRTAVFSNLVPVVALLVAFVWLGEAPGAIQLTGAGVILTGVTLAQRRSGPRGPARP